LAESAKESIFQELQLFKVASRENCRFKEAKIWEITGLWNCIGIRR